MNLYNINAIKWRVASYDLIWSRKLCKGIWIQSKGFYSIDDIFNLRIIGLFDLGLDWIGSFYFIWCFYKIKIFIRI